MPDLNAMIQWAINTCNNSKVGYSQSYRNQQTVGGITYYDCSSFVNYALLAGGWSTPSYAPSHNAFTTYTMIPVLLGLGWQEVPISGEWRQGDILWRQEHTEIVYSGGSGSGVTMGAHSSRYALQRQVSINTYTSSTSYPKPVWEKLYRYTDTPVTPTKPDQKVSMYVIAAICGNFMQESQINPGVWQGFRSGSPTALNVGFGLGQWTNTGGDTHGRLYKMWQYCTENGSVYDGDTQCDYIVYENVWHNNDTSYGNTSLQSFLSSTSTDITALTHDWNINWEGIHDASWDTRVDYARLVLSYLKDHSQDQVDHWIVQNDWITQAQMLQNAVLVYQHFNSEDSGVNPEPVEPEFDGYYRNTFVAIGHGSAAVTPQLAKEGTDVLYTASPDSSEHQFQRWVISWPPDFSLSSAVQESGIVQDHYSMPGSPVVARAMFDEDAGGGPFSASTQVALIVTGNVDLTIMWDAQDGSHPTNHIVFDSNEQVVYNYNIGISDGVHITVNSGTTVTCLTSHVPGWTEDLENNRYFYYQPNTNVTLNVVGTPAVSGLEEQKSKWWMYMRPTWMWNQ